MRSATDITARARIREAAMRQFAEHGVAATTIRTVAQAAGVAPGLVSHHYGSKEGLREACDGYVMDYLQNLLTKAVDEKRIADPNFIAAEYDHAPLLLGYLARALVDGSTAAQSLFDNIVAVTVDYLTTHPPSHPKSDLQAQAAVLVAMRLGVWVLHGHLIRVMGAESATPQFLSRISTAVLDIMSPDFVGADLTNLTRTGLDRFQQQARQD